MNSSIKAFLIFFSTSLIGSALLAAIDAFVFGQVDGKFAHDRAGQFEFVFTLGVLLTVGAIVPMLVACQVFPKFVGRATFRFAFSSAVVTLALFAMLAFLPVSAWIESLSPTAYLIPFCIAVLMGVCGVAGATLICLGAGSKPVGPKSNS